MKRLLLYLNLAVLLTFFPAAAADWYIVDEWDVIVPNRKAFGIDWDDEKVYIVNWYESPPYNTDIRIYTEYGFYLGGQFEFTLNINCTGLDRKADRDHGGTGWYLGSRDGSAIYLVNENGTGYYEFPGPADFDLVYGVVHNQDNDILYISDWSTGRIAWGNLEDMGYVLSWTEKNVGAKYCALEYIRNSGGDYYLLGLNRSSDYWDSELHIWKLNDNGIPEDIYEPDDVADFGDTFYYPADIGWDNDNIWLLNQDYDGITDIDYVTEIALPEYFSDVTTIKPVSFGKVKARFR